MVTVTSLRHGIAKLPIDHFVCFDLEWDIDGKITAD